MGVIGLNTFTEFLEFMVVIPYKQVSRCHYGRNTNYVVHFLAAHYHVYVSGYHSILLFLVICNILMIASAYTAYPGKEFKSGVLICFQNFLEALLPMAYFHILLMLSGDIELNPGPKISKSHGQHGAKGRFMSDFKTDASLAHFDPNQLAARYKVNVRTIQRWLRDCLPLRYSSCNPFSEDSKLVNECDDLLSEKYSVSVRTIKR